MATKLHLGNLPYSATEEEIRNLLGQVGNVVSVELPTDRFTGRPRGFAFVEMESEAGAEEAIKKFDGYTLDGRAIRVEKAREREPRPSGGYGRSSGGHRTGFGGPSHGRQGGRHQGGPRMG